MKEYQKPFVVVTSMQHNSTKNNVGEKVGAVSMLQEKSKNDNTYDMVITNCRCSGGSTHTRV